MNIENDSQELLRVGYSVHIFLYLLYLQRLEKCSSLLVIDVIKLIGAFTDRQQWRKELITADSKLETVENKYLKCKLSVQFDIESASILTLMLL